MLEQAGASARSKVAPALFGLQEELNPAQNQSVGEAFVSLFHQLMNRGRVAAPNPLDIQLGKSTMPAPVEVPVEVENTERSEVESAPEERPEELDDPEVTTQEQQNAALPEEKVALSPEQVEVAAPITQEALVTAELVQVNAVQVAAKNISTKVEVVSASEVAADVTQDPLLQMIPAQQQQIVAKQAISAQKVAHSEETQGVIPLNELFTEVPQSGAAPIAATTQKVAESKAQNPEVHLWQQHTEKDSALLPLLPNFKEREVTPALKANAVTPPVVPVVANPKTQEFLQGALRDWSKGGVSLSVSERRGELTNTQFVSMAQEKRAAAVRDGGKLGKKLEANQAKMLEQIQQLMEKAAQQRNGNSLTIKLDPLELGAMTVKVSQRSDQVFARVQAENPEVERFLRENMGEIIQALAAAGIRGENVHVSIGREISELEQFLAKAHLDNQEKGQRGSESSQGRAQYRGDSEQGSTEVPLEKEGASAESEAGWVA